MDSIERFEKVNEYAYLLDDKIKPSFVEESTLKTITNWDAADEELDEFLNEDGSDSDASGSSQGDIAQDMVITDGHSRSSGSESSDDDWLNAELTSAIETIPAAESKTLKRKHSNS